MALEFHYKIWQKYCLFSLKLSLYLTFQHQITPFLASGNFCRLLITFANSLERDQERQNVGHDLDPNCLTL